MIASTTITIATQGQGLYEFTDEVAGWLRGRSVSEGLLSLFVQHTSASLVIQENADPDVQRDLQSFFKRLVPEDDRLYRHSSEGPDDMPAHIKAALTAVQLSVPVLGGRMALGTWQGLYLFEHRTHPHRRRVVVQLIGE